MMQCLPARANEIPVNAFGALAAIKSLRTPLHGAALRLE
jgi:hypothetical protein